MRCILFSEKSSCYELLFQKNLNSESTLPSFAVTIGPYQITGGRISRFPADPSNRLTQKGPARQRRCFLVLVESLC